MSCWLLDCFYPMYFPAALKSSWSFVCCNVLQVIFVSTVKTLILFCWFIDYKSSKISAFSIQSSYLCSRAITTFVSSGYLPWAYSRIRSKMRRMSRRAKESCNELIWKSTMRLTNRSIPFEVICDVLWISSSITWLYL